MISTMRSDLSHTLTHECTTLGGAHAQNACVRARNSRAVLNWQVAHAWLLCVVFVQLGVLGCVVKGSGVDRI